MVRIRVCQKLVGPDGQRRAQFLRAPPETTPDDSGNCGEAPSRPGADSVQRSAVNARRRLNTDDRHLHARQLRDSGPALREIATALGVDESCAARYVRRGEAAQRKELEPLLFAN